MKKLGFGMMRLPLQNPADNTSVDMQHACRMVDRFLEQGFTYFDTAYLYHGFQSEIFVREALTKRHPRDSYLLADKMSVIFLKEEGDQERIFNEQLRKCGVDYFDYYLVHNLGLKHYAIAQKFDTFAFAAQKKAEGKIRSLGISYHDSAELLDQILTEHPEVEFVQLQINYLDWEDKGIQSRACYEVAVKHGKPVIVMEPIKGGTLAELPEAAEAKLRAVHPDWTPASWAIRYAAGLDQVMLVLSGMSDFDQLEENLATMDDFVPLNEAEHTLIREIADDIHTAIAIPCTSCRYCTDGCPKQIDIPTCFALYNAEKQALNKGFSTQNTYYNNHILRSGKASDCIGCGQCEKACPQHIGIIAALKLVAEAFED